jgi:CheY-like chemotaxis protein
MQERQCALGTTPTGRRVLVVDDNPDIAESTSVLLSLSGYEVQTVLSGEQALEVALLFRPDTVLLDIGMPGLDGYQVCRKLRHQRGLERTRLIAVTGYGAPQDRQRAEEAGFDHYLLKPFDCDALIALLDDESESEPAAPLEDEVGQNSRDAHHH